MRSQCIWKYQDIDGLLEYYMKRWEPRRKPLQTARDYREERDVTQSTAFCKNKITPFDVVECTNRPAWLNMKRIKSLKSTPDMYALPSDSSSIENKLHAISRQRFQTNNNVVQIYHSINSGSTTRLFFRAGICNQHSDQAWKVEPVQNFVAYLAQ